MSPVCREPGRPSGFDRRLIVKFLVDAQLPPALARHLVSLGRDAAHVEDHGLRHAEDPAIHAFARQHGYCVVTKDEDFQLRWLFGRRDVPVVWLRCGNISNRELKERITPLLDDIVQRLQAGESLIEVLH